MKKNALLLILLLIFISCSSSDDSASLPTVDNQETPDENETRLELSGNFVSAAHPTSGMVSVNVERTELMLTNFKSDNGPLLELYIATDINATEYVSLGVIGDLGVIDIIEGDATFVLPNGINFTTHKYIMVWCVDFSVNFGHAILE